MDTKNQPTESQTHFDNFDADKVLKNLNNKVYYDKHRLAILERASAKVTCERCNQVVTCKHLKDHQHSNRCIAMHFGWKYYPIGTRTKKYKKTT